MDEESGPSRTGFVEQVNPLELARKGRSDSAKLATVTSKTGEVDAFQAAAASPPSAEPTAPRAEVSRLNPLAQREVRMLLELAGPDDDDVEEWGAHRSTSAHVGALADDASHKSRKLGIKAAGKFPSAVESTAGNVLVEVAREREATTSDADGVTKNGMVKLLRNVESGIGSVDPTNILAEDLLSVAKEAGEVAALEATSAATGGTLSTIFLARTLLKKREIEANISKLKLSLLQLEVARKKASLDPASREGLNERLTQLNKVLRYALAQLDKRLFRTRCKATAQGMMLTGGLLTLGTVTAELGIPLLVGGSFGSQAITFKQLKNAMDKNSTKTRGVERKANAQALCRLAMRRGDASRVDPSWVQANQLLRDITGSSDPGLPGTSRRVATEKKVFKWLSSKV